MKRIAWLTDIHLNFLENHRVRAFCRKVAEKSPDCVLVGGDIGEALNVEAYLHILEDELPFPIYFVLGNHDYYGGSIARVTTRIKDMVRGSSNLHWLRDEGVVQLSPETCLMGHGAWADGRLGDYQRSDVELNDYLLIAELKGLNRNARLKKLNDLGDEAAVYLKGILSRALDNFRHVILLTHVPPFKEACWYQGHISDDNYLPHFGCKCVGEVLVQRMRLYPNKNMTVLCGHTHGGGRAQVLPNLEIKTGDARYGSPKIQELLMIP